LSVKNGAELLDRLVKDIVSESAATYVSIVHAPPELSEHQSHDGADSPHQDLPMAFNLERFLPLLEERINVLNPYTRSFLVAWITLLDSIPDLELIAHLPRFLRGLFRFLSDSNQDVYTMTQASLDKFLVEIRKIARIKKGIAESKKSHSKDDHQRSSSSLQSEPEDDSEATSGTPVEPHEAVEDKENGSGDSGSTSSSRSGKSVNGDGNWIPGQDVQVDHPKILEILVDFLSVSAGRRCPPFNTDEKLTVCRHRRGTKRNTADRSSLDRQSLRYMSRRHYAICPKSLIARAPKNVTRRRHRSQGGGQG
jgi:vacuole morphology and inheritance protein 14